MSTAAGEAAAMRMDSLAAVPIRIAAVVLLLTLVVYAQVASFTFLDFDDGEYVYGNEHVTSGLTLDGVRWAFTQSHAANRHPLTWISHMIDVQLFGVNPGPHHVVNLLFHLLNVVLVFAGLWCLTKRAGPSAFVAALFAIHPLNVENVAWIAERKSLLSTSFGLLAIFAYVSWTEKRGPARYGLALALFACSLMSKPMLVTLPFLLLVIDYWPLRRFRNSTPRLFVEKAPFLALAVISGVITYRSQDAIGATASFPLRERVLNALITCAWYPLKAIAPVNLSFYYPHPANVHQAIPLALPLVAFVVLTAMTVLLFRFRSRLPYAFAGWLWYGIALAPVIGIVQVGGQARADRYAYIPLLGIFVAITWMIADNADRLRLGRRELAFAAAGIIASLSVLCFVQTRFWRTPEALYQHAISLDSTNWLAWNNLGRVYLDDGDLPRSVECFSNALRAKKDFDVAAYNMGVALGKLGRDLESTVWYTRSLEIDPANADAWVNLGYATLRLGKSRQAMEYLTTALRTRPNDPVALYGLALSQAHAGDMSSSFATYASLRQIDPASAADLLTELRTSPTR